MSRSRWASTWGRAPVTSVTGGARKQARLVHRARLQHTRFARTGPSITRLFWVMAVSVPVLALAPAAVASRTSRVRAHHHNLHTNHVSARPRHVSTGHDVRVRLSYRRDRSSDPALSTAQLLLPGTGYYGRNGSRLVRALQVRLARAGDAPGPIDGRYGPLTENAVKRYQGEHGLIVDGIAGPQTLAALAAPTAVLYPGAGYGMGGSAPVRALQRDLKRAGDSPGPIDGLYGPLTEQAVRRFQAAHRLTVDGIAGPQTVMHLGRQRVRTRLLRRPPRRSRPSMSRPKPTPVRPVAHSGRRVTRPTAGTPIVWFVLVGFLGAGLLLVTASYTRRRNRRRDVLLRQGAGGAIGASREPEARRQTEEVREPDAAISAIRSALARDGADGVFDLGVALQEKGDMAGAWAAYSRADERGHPAAATNLGVLMEARGDLAGAEEAYRRAADRGDPNGAFNLGVLLEERGSMAAAADAYRRADEQEHAEAASNLGVLLEHEGDAAGAEAAYRRAVQRGDASGAFNLGMLLEERGDFTSAKRAYRRAEECGQPEVAMRARSALLGLQNRGQRSSSSRGRGDHNV